MVEILIFKNVSLHSVYVVKRAEHDLIFFFFFSIASSERALGSFFRLLMLTEERLEVWKYRILVVFLGLS